MLFAATLSALFAIAPKPTGTQVTIYNQGFALVKESREFNLKAGRQNVAVEDVASMIEPASVGFRSLTDPKGLQVLEQNYQFDLISPMAILNKAVGHRVIFRRMVGNNSVDTEGLLLSAPTYVAPSNGNPQAAVYGGMVIRTDAGEIVLDPVGTVIVKQVPEGLISKPTLLWDLIADKAGPNQVELSYITQGISWDASYVMTLQGANNLADLQGWVTINNQSGGTYGDANLKLLAGDVNVAQRGGGNGGIGGGRAFDAAKAANTFAEESLFEYHLYTLGRPATIRNKEIKQLALLEGKDIKVEKRLILDALQGYNDYYPNEGTVGSGTMSPQVRIEFMNTKENALGMPLPMGKFKIYQRDASGSVQMLGEDNIRHTPRNEKISIVVGKSFDIVANRKRTAFQILGPTNTRETFEIELRNRKEVPDHVTILERHWGDWKVTATSDKYEKVEATVMQYDIPLKANEVRTVKYTVETRWG